MEAQETAREVIVIRAKRVTRGYDSQCALCAMALGWTITKVLVSGTQYTA